LKLGVVVHLKKLRRTKGGAKIVWVFRVKNHDFTSDRIFTGLYYISNKSGVLNKELVTLRDKLDSPSD
jgi:hypothetical protein